MIIDTEKLRTQVAEYWRDKASDRSDEYVKATIRHLFEDSAAISKVEELAEAMESKR